VFHSFLQHLIYFFGSGDWGFVEFKNVRPFLNSTPPDELINPLFFKGLNPKKRILPRPLTPRLAAMHKKGVKIAVRELKKTNKWTRADWLDECDDDDDSDGSE
jgi:hypothetical protein